MAEGKDPNLSGSITIGNFIQGGTIKDATIQSNVQENPERINPGETRLTVGTFLSDTQIENVKLLSNVNTTPPDHQEMNEEPEPQGLNCSGTGSSRCSSGSHPVAGDRGESYKMKSHPYRGAAFILNNSYFPKMRQPERKGSDVDFENAKKLWKRYGFYVKTYNNKSAEEIIDEIKDFLALDKVTRTDCVVVMLMSHGGEGVLRGSDSMPIKYSDIFALFQPDVCPELKKKPKIFFIQACRGKNIEVGVDSNQFEDEHEMMGDAGDAKPTPFENCLKTPLPADFYIAYSTCDGFFSMRDKNDGSVFIQALVEIFIALADKEDLKSLMTKVFQKVSYELRQVTIAKRRVKMLQQPQEHSTLNKKVYFQVKE